MASGTKKSIFRANAFPLKNRIAITTGDPKGVGSYIVHKSLAELSPTKNFQFLIWSSGKKPLKKIKGFQIKTFKNYTQALKEPFKENCILEILGTSPRESLMDAGSLCMKKEVSALITGPVSKASLGKGLVGQTDLLKKMSKTKSVFMTFRGEHFNVALLNDHTPFRKTSLTKSQLKNMVEHFLMYRDLLDLKSRKKPLGVLGLNPHAGEDQILGTEEEKIIKPLLKKYSQAEGPLSPDSAFLEKNWSRYSYYLALYHDQGLIPFKMIHNHQGFAMSLGLPFLRLGVDHGTGAGLSEKNISHRSFLLALKEAIKIIKRFQ